MKVLFLILFGILLSITLANSQDIETGLVAYYPLDGSAEDLSGNELDGTIFGATMASDRFDRANSAVDFDGIDDYITVPDNDLLDFGTGTFSVSLWMKATMPEQGSQMLLQKGLSGPGAGQFWLRINDFNPTIRLKLSTTDGNPPATEIISTRSLFNAGQWHHIVAQRNNNKLELWVDSELIVELPNIPNRDVDGDGSLIIGAQNPFLDGMIPNIHNYFSGSLDEIRLYNRTLTSEEIVEVSNTYCPDSYLISENLQFKLYKASTDISTSGEVVLEGKSTLRAGEFISFNPGFSTTMGAEMIAKIEDCSNTVVSAFADPSIEIPRVPIPSMQKTGLINVYPNPSRVDFTVEYFLNEASSNEVIIVFDSQGHLVKRLSVDQLDTSKGQKTIDLNMDQLPAGVYYLHFRSDATMEVHKIIKIK